MTTKGGRVFGISLLLMFCMLFLLPMHSQAQTESNDLIGVKVAIYQGYGVMISSQTALMKMFEWMNATVAIVNASQIRNGVLDAYDIFVVPGGSETIYSGELEADGRQTVKDFIGGGGSYFGICGGATFGAEYLHLFRGSMGPVSEPGPTIHMTTMHINRSSTGPDLSNCLENISTLYYASQYFTPSVGTPMQVIASYDYDGRAGMISFKYKNGTVFLSSPHPEYEENSDRDGTTFVDYLDDPESEWNLLLSVSEWLVEESITEPSDSANSPDLLIVAAASTASVVIVSAAVVLYRRKHA
jgi:glutamine amidotransferase-like uncharacterized protein